ncbi:penicillin amidase family protein, putative, partial [Ichthyophthirius multifiliis]
MCLLLENLRKNKIKTWMLTGQQYTKALPTAYQCELLQVDKKLENIFFDSTDYDDLKLLIKRNLEKLQIQFIGLLLYQLLLQHFFFLGVENNKYSAFSTIKNHEYQRRKSRIINLDNDLESQIQFQIIIKGDTLDLILKDPIYLRSHFLFLSHFCKFLVAYEISSSTKQLLINLLQIQNTNNKFLSISNDISLSNQVDFSIMVQNQYNQCFGDVSIRNFKDIYKLIFIHSRRQADFISILINLQIYRQFFLYLYSFLNIQYNCLEGYSFLQPVEIFIYNFFINFFSMIPIFNYYFNPKVPNDIVIDENNILFNIQKQYLTSKQFWIKTQIFTYFKIFSVSLIQSLVLFLVSSFVFQVQSIQGKNIGYQTIGILTYLQQLFIIQCQIAKFIPSNSLINIIYQIFLFFIYSFIYIFVLEKNNNIKAFGEIIEFFSVFYTNLVFFSFLILNVFIFDIFDFVIYLIPITLNISIVKIRKIFEWYQNKYSILNRLKLFDQIRKNQKNNYHLSLVNIIRQYFKGNSEIDELIQQSNFQIKKNIIFNQKVVNINLDNVSSEMNAISLTFINKDLENKYIRVSIQNWLYFGRFISIFQFLTIDFFFLLIFLLGQFQLQIDNYLVYYNIIKYLFILFNYKDINSNFNNINFYLSFINLFLMRVIYFILILKVIELYESFINFANFVYILYFMLQIRVDIQIFIYFSLAIYNCINFTYTLLNDNNYIQINIQYKVYYIINTISFVFLNMIFISIYKYRHSQFDRLQYLSENKIQLEMKKFSDVLSILLPKFIREQISSEQSCSIKIENQIAIIFCDIYNFDEIIAKQNVEVVKLLDNLFRAFDILCTHNNIQKIETVGKTYMACAGIQQSNHQQVSEGRYDETNAVRCAINFGFQILEYTNALTFGDEGQKIIFKIGIHFGQVIAGVIGYHKPQFSLIGDTVNTSSRICITSEPGVLTLSEDAQQQVQFNKDLSFIQKNVEAKGKGFLITFQVFQKKAYPIKKKEKSLFYCQNRIKEQNDSQSILYNILDIKEQKIIKNNKPEQFLFNNNSNKQQKTIILNNQKNEEISKKLNKNKFKIFKTNYSHKIIQKTNPFNHIQESVNILNNQKDTLANVLNYIKDDQSITYIDKILENKNTLNQMNQKQNKNYLIKNNKQMPITLKNIVVNDNIISIHETNNADSFNSMTSKFFIFQFEDIKRGIIVEQTKNQDEDNYISSEQLKQLYKDSQNNQQNEQKNIDQYNLDFKNCFFFKTTKQKQDLVNEFFINQIYNFQANTQIQLWIWYVFMIFKIISCLFVSKQLSFEYFIIQIIIRFIFQMIYTIFVLKYKYILQKYPLLKIKVIIYCLYLLQYIIFIYETSGMQLKGGKSFSSSLQSAEALFFIFNIYIIQFLSFY